MKDAGVKFHGSRKFSHTARACCWRTCTATGDLYRAAHAAQRSKRGRTRQRERAGGEGYVVWPSLIASHSITAAVSYPARTVLTNLYLTLLDCLAVPVNSVGNSTGPLSLTP